MLDLYKSVIDLTSTEYINMFPIVNKYNANITYNTIQDQRKNIHAFEYEIRNISKYFAVGLIDLIIINITELL